DGVLTRRTPPFPRARSFRAAGSTTCCGSPPELCAARPPHSTLTLRSRRALAAWRRPLAAQRESPGQPPPRDRAQATADRVLPKLARPSLGEPPLRSPAEQRGAVGEHTLGSPGMALAKNPPGGKNE